MGDKAEDEYQSFGGVQVEGADNFGVRGVYLLDVGWQKCVE